MSKLNVYAWDRPGITNFGDELGPDILRRLGHDVVRAPIQAAEVVVCGSVLEKAIPAPRGCIIAGAGTMWGGTRPLPNPKHLDIRALRGNVSWRSMNDRSKTNLGDIPLGDPGILAPVLYDLAPRQARRVGVVPHYVDSRTFNFADVVIDVTAPPHEVIWEISKCSYIMSSSLHGLIAAQALGIPAMRMPYNRVIGGDVKWVDFVSGFMSGDQATVTKNLIQVLEDL